MRFFGKLKVFRAELWATCSDSTETLIKWMLIVAVTDHFLRKFNGCRSWKVKIQKNQKFRKIGTFSYFVVRAQKICHLVNGWLKCPSKRVESKVKNSSTFSIFLVKFGEYTFADFRMGRSWPKFKLQKRCAIWRWNEQKMLRLDFEKWMRR